MQNAVDMGKTSVIKTFNQATFGTTYLKHNGQGTLCGDPSGKYCDAQSIPYNTFKRFEFDEGNKIEDTIVEPVSLEVNDMD